MYICQRRCLIRISNFGDKLYANVAGPSDNPDTLYSILAIAGEVLSNKGGWRDTGF